MSWACVLPWTAALCMKELVSKLLVLVNAFKEDPLGWDIRSFGPELLGLWWTRSRNLQIPIIQILSVGIESQLRIMKIFTCMYIYVFVVFHSCFLFKDIWRPWLKIRRNPGLEMRTGYRNQLFRLRLCMQPSCIAPHRMGGQEGFLKNPRRNFSLRFFSRT